MDERNGDCFPHHEEFYAPLSTSDSEHDCLKEFLLEPSTHEQNLLLNTTMGYGNGTLSMPTSSDGSAQVMQNIIPNLGCELNAISQQSVTINQINQFVNSQFDLVQPLVQDLVQPAVHDLVQPLVQDLVQPIVQDLVQPVVQDLTHTLIQDLTQPLDFQSPGHSIDGSAGVLDNGNMVSECSAKNGECWSPGSRTGECLEEGGDAGASVRTVSSDCVSSETVCSPEGDCVVEEKQIRRRKRKTTHQPRQRNTTKTTYHSQISPDQNGIKIRIKKSLTLAPQRPRKRKSKEPIEDEPSDEEPAEQSGWADRIPEPILYNIFYMVTKMEGCVPFLVR